jgi:hypothetical protein
MKVTVYKRKKKSESIFKLKLTYYLLAKLTKTDEEKKGMHFCIPLK